METVVQWATILSPIIAVLIAWLMIHKSSKATAKQVESIKQLARIQIETSMIQINKELWEANTRNSMANTKIKEMEDNRDMLYHLFGNNSDYYSKRGEIRQGLNDERNFQTIHANVLKQYQDRLKELSKHLKIE